MNKPIRNQDLKSLKGVFIEAYPIHDGVIDESEAEELDIEKSKGIQEEDFDWKDSMR